MSKDEMWLERVKQKTSPFFTSVYCEVPEQRKIPASTKWRYQELEKRRLEELRLSREPTEEELLRIFATKV